MARDNQREPWEQETSSRPKAGKIVLAVLLVGAVIALAGYGLFGGGQKVACGWGDNANGRVSYSKQEVADGALDDQAVFNSLSDGDFGNEKRYISARKAESESNAAWTYRELTVKDGETYTLRIYLHNNGGQTATGTRVAINLPTDSARQIPVHGFIFSDNTTPSQYWDGILFKANQEFHLEYLYGGAELTSGELGTIPLDDAVVTKAASERGVQVGYSAKDGEMPGGAECFVTVKVRVAMDEPHAAEKVSFMTEVKVRQEGATEWQKSTAAKAGDTLEVQFQYRNTGTATQNQVMASVVLPEGTELVPGTTKLYNVLYEDGLLIEEDTVAESGIPIGNYSANSNAYVRCTVRVTEDGTKDIWAKITVGETVEQDFCKVEPTT